jgi:hypothetical protein
MPIFILVVQIAVAIWIPKKIVMARTVTRTETGIVIRIETRTEIGIATRTEIGTRTARERVGQDPEIAEEGGN